jgi:hypothetical protein
MVFRGGTNAETKSGHRHWRSPHLTVARDRNWVTQVFTSPKVKKTIQEKGIELIDYQDLK